MLEVTRNSCTKSLSARRAWIEIKYVVKDSDFAGVALRKESVDRNTSFLLNVCLICVALRKESVDRNSTEPASLTAFTSRSPQGERG